MKQSLTKALVLLVLAAGVLASSDYYLNVGSVSSGHTTEVQKFRAVRLLKLEQVKEQFLYLVVSDAEELDESIHMAIFVNDAQAPMMICESKNIDACVIPSDRLKVGDQLLLAIQCDSECRYTVQTYWGSAITLTPNQPSKFTFDEDNKAQIYHIDLQSEQLQQFRLIVLPASQRVPGDSVKIYGNYGFNTQPTIEQHDFESQNLWKDGQGIFLDASEMTSKQLSFLVVGETQTIYEMMPELVREEKKEIVARETLYEFMEKESEKIYHSTFDKELVDQYSFHLAKFSGEVQITFFKDEQLTQEYEIRHFEYMNDIKYLAVNEQLKKDGVSEVYIRAKTTTTNAVFMMNFEDALFNGPSALTESVYDFLPIHKKKIAYLHLESFTQGHSSQQREINVNLVKVLGSVSAEFRLCNYDPVKCIDVTTYEENSNELVPADNTIMGMKSSFKFKINPNSFLQMNEFESSAVMIVIFENNNSDQTPSLISVDYSIGDEIQDLRQAHPIETMIDKNQVKYFKFVNSDSSVRAAKIHISPIRGKIEAFGSYQDPRVSQEDLIESVSNQVVFTKKHLDKAVYVMVKGLEPASFAVTVQLDHEQMQFSTLSLQENIEYTLRIKPQGGEIVKVNPIYKSLKLNFRSSNEVHVCSLDENSQCLEGTKPVVSKNGEIKVENHADTSKQLVIGNPSDNMFVEVKVIYHSDDYEHCEQRFLEEHYSETVSHEDCFAFPLSDKLDDIGFVIDRHDIGPLQVKAYACYQEVDIDSPARILIPKEVLEQKCKDNNIGDRTVSLVFNGDPNNEDETMKIQFSGYYFNSIINLADGVAFRANGRSGQGKLSTFYYHAINMVDTFVMLKNIRGDFKFYTKIINPKNRDNTSISEADYDLQSASSNFFQNPSLTITVDDFNRNPCSECGVLIAIYSVGDIGGQIEYSLEVFQNEIVLKDHMTYDMHLSKESFVCYQYESQRPEGECNLIVEVSDHNKDCAAIYLSDREYPSDQNYLAREKGSKLVYSDCGVGMYYLTVVAIEDCPYSISISNTKYSVTKATRGVPVGINLEENEVKFVLFRHLSQAGFKLVTLEKFGSVDIYANVLDPNHLDTLKNQEDLDYKSFTFKGSYKDTLYIDSQDPNFCTDCYYIIAIEGLESTQSSLVVADSEVPIQMVHKKILNDELLNLGDKTYIQFKNVLAGKLPFQIHSGEVKATIKYKKQSSYHTFEKKKELQIYEFELETEDGHYDWAPIKVEVECLQAPCAYSVGLIDTTQEMVQTAIVPGTPAYALFLNDNQQCFSGYLRDADDDIVITIDRSQTSLLKNIKTKLLINKMETSEFTISSILNVMTLKPNFSTLNLTSTAPYELCIELNNEGLVSVIIEQGEDINLLPEDLQVLVREEDTFLVYPQGPFLVDIFECAGETSFKHGFNEQEMEQDMNQLSEVAMPDQPHAVKITSFLPTFLKIKSDLSIIRWLPIDEITERGLGYFKYGVGELRYETSENDIQIKWESVKKNKDTNTTVKNISYKLFISDSVANLKSAASCEKFLAEDVILINLDISQDQTLGQSLSYTISKDQIGKKFKGRKDNIYINLVADMSLQVPQAAVDSEVEGESPDEYYRFLYHVQEIPKDVFAGHQGSLLDEPLILGGVIAGVALLVLIILYVLLKKLIPMISRARNNNMIEEADGENKQDIQVTPVIQSNERIVVDDA